MDAKRHAQDLAALRYIQLGSPGLLFKTWEAFGLEDHPPAPASS